MLFDYLYSQGEQIYLIDCEITEEGLIAELSRFTAGLKPGIYELGDNAIKPSCAIEITEEFSSKCNFVFDEPVIFKLVERYD